MNLLRDPRAMRAAAVLAASLVAAVLLVFARPAPEEVRPGANEPLLRTVVASSQDVPVTVRAQGRVQARAEIDLAAEISGRVVEVSPSLAAGGFFRAGDTLVRIDPVDYELAVERVRAEVAAADVQVAMEVAEAEVATEEWKALDGSKPPALVARVPQLAQARARAAAARAELERARLDLERTTLRAPFDGRVRSEHVDVAQLVTRGATLARIYSTDVAEIRVPLVDADLAHLDLSLDSPGQGPTALVTTTFAGVDLEWRARIDRIEGQIDEATHMVHVVAVVDDPYGRESKRQEPPLAVGMFVDVAIHGRTARGVFALPRAALRNEHEMLVVDAENRLRRRTVTVLRREPDRVIVRDGLYEGDRVCVSPLEIAVDGMKVRVAGEAAKEAGAS